MTDDIQKRDLSRFNGFLRGERTAVETYCQCIEKLRASQLHDELALLRESHQKRVLLLTDWIVSFGGIPQETTGAWWHVAKLAEGGATLLGDAAALGVLAFGEERGREEYEHVEELGTCARRFVVETLIPEQLRTWLASRRLLDGLTVPN